MKPMTKAQSILRRNCRFCRWRRHCVSQAYRYDIKGLVLSPFGNASFAGVYREEQDEVKKP
ncbi:hypothetical protein ACLB1T_26150 [Escherichia coli]